MLTESEGSQLESEGYVIVDEVFDPDAVLGPIEAEHLEVLDGIEDRQIGEGKLEHRSVGEFGRRLVSTCSALGTDLAQHFDISLPQDGITTKTPLHVGDAVFALLINDDLLDLVESAIGPEIYSCPVQHTRIKLPSHALGRRTNSLSGTVPFHQDNGVLLEEADESTILTVWIPATPATIENGCLHVVPRSHCNGHLYDHCPGGPGGLEIPARVLGDTNAVPLPMNPGSVLLMHQRTVHGSLANHSDGVRVSLDLRYQPVGQPTGRPAFDDAGFIARSRAEPDRALRDPVIWRRQWLELRDRLANGVTPRFNRWSADAPACA